MTTKVQPSIAHLHHHHLHRQQPPPTPHSPTTLGHPSSHDHRRTPASSHTPPLLWPPPPSSYSFKLCFLGFSSVNMAKSSVSSIIVDNRSLASSLGNKCLLLFIVNHPSKDESFLGLQSSVVFPPHFHGFEPPLFNSQPTGSSFVYIAKSSVSSIIVDNNSQVSSSCNKCLQVFIVIHLSKDESFLSLHSLVVIPSLFNGFEVPLFNPHPTVFGSVLVAPRLDHLQMNGPFASFFFISENQNAIEEQVLISSSAGELVAQLPECSVDTSPIKISGHQGDKSLGSVNIWDKVVGLFCWVFAASDICSMGLSWFCQHLFNGTIIVFSCKHSLGAGQAEGECRDTFSVGFLQHQAEIKQEQKAVVTKVLQPLVDKAQEDFQIASNGDK